MSSAAAGPEPPRAASPPDLRQVFARIGSHEGMKLVLGDVQQDALDAAVAEARAAGVEALGMRVDVSKPDEVEQLAALAAGRFRAVHLLFNNAGVAGGGGYVWESS